MKTISLRLPDGLHARLEQKSQRRWCSKAEVVRAAVEQCLPGDDREDGDGAERRLSFLEAAGDLIGCVEGPSDLSTNPKYLEGMPAWCE